MPKRGEPYITCDVIIALNTDRAAEYQGTIRVALGDEVIEVPVTASVLAQEPGLSRVLLVDTPIQRYSTDDASVFNPWLELVKRAKLDPHYLEIERGRPVLRELDLTKFDVVLIWGDGLFSATATDFDKLRGFVDSGGRCIVAANHFFQGSVARANEFIVPFGLRMKDEEPPGVPAVTVTVAQDWLAKHLLTQGVGNLKFFRPSPIAVEDEAHAELLVTAPLFPGHGFAAVAHSGRGEVVVLGISLWSYWIASEMESGADNAVMLGNLLAKP
ncbi:MAG: hypothetical protein ACKV0T_16620 [Planctomycetales bacterium]